MSLSKTRRQFLIKGSVAAGGALTLSGNTAAEDTVTLEGRILDYEGSAVPDARIYVTSPNGGYIRTDDDGYFSTQVEPNIRVTLGFYKSDESHFLAPRMDGVPHIHPIPDLTVDGDGLDIGDYELPEAHTLEAQAVFANRPGGVEDAIPRFGSIRDGFYFASGYSYTTTNQAGYMKLKSADFTGIEMAGKTRLWMYAPTYVPYEEQDKEDYAPYEKVDITTMEVTDRTMIESDISRRKENRRNGK